MAPAAGSRRFPPTSPQRVASGICSGRLCNATAGSICCSTTQASGATAVDIDAVELDDWNKVAVNLTGAFLCTREAFRVMRQQRPMGGRIINNGSISAHAPRPRSIAYTATKHAITGLTKSTALDGRAFDIACGQIDIGNAATELMSGAASGAAQADGTVRPEPLMDVAEVGRAVCYMAGLPLEANVATMTVMATKMPFVGRG